MKIFAIKDADNNDKLIGFFFFRDRDETCSIELMEGIDEWDCPFVLNVYARRNEYTIGDRDTRKFIGGRVIPSDRQNITSILVKNKLNAYDEVKLFILADGRCAQDQVFIEPVTYEELPDSIKMRRERTLISATHLGCGSYLITLKDGSLLRLDLKDIKGELWVARLLKYAEYLSDVCAENGGTELNIHGDTLTYDKVAKKANPVSIKRDEMLAAALSNILSTQDVMKLLNCTRQNVNDLVKRGRLSPLKINANVSFFDLKDVQALM